MIGCFCFANCSLAQHKPYEVRKIFDSIPEFEEFADLQHDYMIYDFYKEKQVFEFGRHLYYIYTKTTTGRIHFTDSGHIHLAKSGMLRLTSTATNVDVFWNAGRFENYFFYTTMKPRRSFTKICWKQKVVVT
jgi:hypothetical protein